jgi:hypothetical protein
MIRITEGKESGLPKIILYVGDILVDIIRQVKSSQVNVNEVGGACGMHGRGEESVQGFGGKARRKETTGKTKA